MASEDQDEREMLELVEVEEPNEINHVKDPRGGSQVDVMVSPAQLHLRCILSLQDPLPATIDELLVLLGDGGKDAGPRDALLPEKAVSLTQKVS